MCRSEICAIRGSWKAGGVIATTVGTLFAAACGGTHSDSGKQASTEAAITTCDDGVQKESTLYVKAQANYCQFDTNISNSGEVTTTPRQCTKENLDIGQTAITIAACKPAATGEWSVVSPPTSRAEGVPLDLELRERGAEGVSIRPLTGDRGFGVFVRKITNNSVKIESVVCRKKPAPLTLLGVANFVTDLPVWPGGWGVAAWAVNKALPDGPGSTYPCGRLGAESIPLSLTDRGDAHLHVPERYLHSSSWTLDGSCYPAMRYCGTTFEQSISIEVLQPSEEGPTGPR
jgi:hypothetical protein